MSRGVRQDLTQRIELQYLQQDFSIAYSSRGYWASFFLVVPARHERGLRVQLCLPGKGIVLVEIGEFGDVFLSGGDLIAHKEGHKMLDRRRVLD